MLVIAPRWGEGEENLLAIETWRAKDTEETQEGRRRGGDAGEERVVRCEQGDPVRANLPS